MDTHDERGWVKPIDDGYGAVFMDPIEPTGRTMRSSVVSGIILVALIAAAVAATVAWRGRNGDPFASARSVPAEMDYVITFDALALSDSERLQSFVDAFALPMVEADLIDEYSDDLIATIDKAMFDANGLTLTNDVVPWIGRSVSIAGTVPRFDDPYDYAPEFSLLLSADVRDLQAAEAFVDTVIDKLVANDVDVTVAEIAALPGHRFDMGPDQPAAAMVLTDNSLLFGMEADVAAAIEARDAGLSIADDAVFQDTMSHLSSDRMVAVYAAPSALTGVTDLAALAAPGQEVTTEASFIAVAAAVSLVDEGLLFSYVMVGEEEAQGAFTPDTSVLAGLPDDTLGYVSVKGTGSEQPIDEDALAGLGYPLDELSAEVGIDIVAVLESLSGDLTVAATENRNGSIAAATDVPIGVVGVLGLNDPGPMTELLDLLEDFYAEAGASARTSDGVTTVDLEGEEIISYSVRDDLMVVGTGTDIVADIASGGDGGLLSSALYQDLDAVIAGDGLVLYADIARIAGLVPMTTDEAAVIAPVRGAGFGGEVRGEALVMEFLVLVDY
jgi:hypothetical protein